MRFTVGDLFFLVGRLKTDPLACFVQLDIIYVDKKLAPEILRGQSLAMLNHETKGGQPAS